MISRRLLRSERGVSTPELGAIFFFVTMVFVPFGQKVSKSLNFTFEQVAAMSVFQTSESNRDGNSSNNDGQQSDNGANGWGVNSQGGGSTETQTWTLGNGGGYEGPP